MTKTEVQLLSKAQAVEIKAYAVAGTIKERVEWCSQHTNYIRANRPSYYVSDAQRTKILDPDEVRNELARLNLLKNTEYKPTRYNISFNYIANPPIQKRIEDLQGRIQFHLDTPMVPPYGRIVYDYTNPTWIPSAIKNAQSNCLTGVRKQNRIDILDWTLEIREVSLIINLDTEEISYMGTKLPCDLRKGACQPTPFTKATIVWEPQTHCQLFELIRFDAFMVKYQDRYWIETNAEWTTVQKPDMQEKIKLNITASIATRFEIYPIVEHECGSLQPLHKSTNEQTPTTTVMETIWFQDKDPRTLNSPHNSNYNPLLSYRNWKDMPFDSREYNFFMAPLHNLKDRVSEYFPPLPPENTNTVKRSTKNMGRDKLHQTMYPILKQFYSLTERFLYDYDYEFKIPITCHFDLLIAKASQDLSAYSIYDHQIFQLSFNFLHPSPKDVQNNSYRVHETKLIHNLIYYTFLRDKSNNTSRSCIHINDQLTSPYFLNYGYRLKWENTLGTLRNFDPIKNY